MSAMIAIVVRRRADFGFRCSVSRSGVPHRCSVGVSFAAGYSMRADVSFAQFFDGWRGDTQRFWSQAQSNIYPAVESMSKSQSAKAVTP